MGYIRHKALIITMSNDLDVGKFLVAVAAIGLSDLMCEPVFSRVNARKTVMIAPDGSKEGWAESDEADEQLTKLMEWLDAQRYEDGSTPYAWVLVSYGSDDRNAAVDQHAWDRPTPPPEEPETESSFDFQDAHLLQLQGGVLALLDAGKALGKSRDQILEDLAGTMRLDRKTLDALLDGDFDKVREAASREKE